MTAPTDTASLTLAALMAQARQEGSSIVTLRALVEEASELGAQRALHRLGLHDEDASIDIHDLRTLLEAWRDARKTAGRALVRWLIRLVLTASVLVLAVKFNAAALLR